MGYVGQIMEKGGWSVICIHCIMVSTWFYTRTQREGTAVSSRRGVNRRAGNWTAVPRDRWGVQSSGFIVQAAWWAVGRGGDGLVKKGKGGEQRGYIGEPAERVGLHHTNILVKNCKQRNNGIHGRGCGRHMGDYNSNYNIQILYTGI